MLKIFKNLDKEIASIILEINNKSSFINKMKGINETGSNAIIKLNKSLRLIQDVEANEDNIKILKKIDGYLHDLNISDNSNLIHLYEVRISNIIRSVFIKKEKYNEVKEQVLEKVFLSEIKKENAATNAEDIQARMQEITNTIIKNNISKNSPRYRVLAAEFNSLKLKFNSQEDRINKMIELKRRNDMFEVSKNKEEDLQTMKDLMTMTLEEFIAKTERINKMQSEEDFITKMMDETFSKLQNDTVEMITDDSELQKSIEKTLLESIEDAHPNSFERELEKLPFEELFEGISEINSKIDKLERSVKSLDEEELLKKLKKISSVASDDEYLLRETNGDLKKTVNHFLEMVPRELQSASLKVRSCIENWFRYVKGVDLNNNYVFKKNELVKNKMKSAQIPDELISKLEKYYKATNPYIHNNIEQISLLNDDERAAQLKEAVDFLTNSENQFDKIDYNKGIVKFYMSEDSLLKKYIDDNLKSNKTINNAKTWFNKQEKRKKFIEKKNIEVPKVFFNSIEDINKYLKEQGEDDTITGKVLWFDSNKKFGRIEGNNGSEYFLHISKVTNFNDEVKKNMKVKFTPALDKEKRNIALDVNILN